MRYQETSTVWLCSGIDCWGCGGGLFAAEASNVTSRGPVYCCWVADGYRHPVSSILILQFASPLVIRDKNRMR